MFWIQTGCPAELRKQFIDILELRGRWIEEKVEQVNQVYDEPFTLGDRS